MKSQTQLNWVKQKLKENGKVSRNEALAVFITRLGARIKDLQNLGWKIEGKNVKENGGTNYVYLLEERPKQLKVIVENGIARKIYI